MFFQPSDHCFGPPSLGPRANPVASRGTQFSLLVTLLSRNSVCMLRHCGKSERAGHLWHRRSKHAVRMRHRVWTGTKRRSPLPAVGFVVKRRGLGNGRHAREVAPARRAMIRKSVGAHIRRRRLALAIARIRANRIWAVKQSPSSDGVPNIKEDRRPHSSEQRRSGWESLKTVSAFMRNETHTFGEHQANGFGDRDLGLLHGERQNRRTPIVGQRTKHRCACSGGRFQLEYQPPL